MNTIYKLVCISLFVTGMSFFSGCNDFLDVEPPSDITPENYLSEESHLAAFTINRYEVFANHWSGSYGLYGLDANTDNQVTPYYNSIFTETLHHVGLSGGDWDFKEIYNINYFLNIAVPRWRNGEISGNETNIKHYIGEMYFFRAAQYFNKLVALGDFPIITTVQPTIKEELIEASKRMPRTEVARFIINDLDSATLLLSPKAPDGRKNRVSLHAAQLLKSRVALFEASWLTNFRNTPFVPNGPGWPGADMEYNKGYQFQAGSLEEEVKWLLDQCLKASAEVADAHTLTANTYFLPQSPGEFNPYIEMYGAVDLSGYDEVLLWKEYSRGLELVHSVPSWAATGNASVGLTRGMIDGFLMADGLPTYASAEYQGDNSIEKVVAGRDGRMQLFVKVPGQLNGYISEQTIYTKGHITEPYPDILNGAGDDRYASGYACRKGWNPDIDQWWYMNGYTGCIIFRATEAYLNYIEACYLLHHSLDDKATNYWKAIRRRGGVEEDFMKTVRATDLQKESAGDWGAYTAGALLDDPVLYNIRRERRIELMAEGFRWMDLKRWRSLDQMKTTPYHLEGFKLWNSEMTDWYGDELVDSGSDPNVSPRSESDYLRPQEVHSGVIRDQGGLKWKMGHYLNPVAASHFMASSEQTEGFTDSPIYQNPYWSKSSAQPATE
ncbi:MAG: RagB/SusD family nutrient uptake outer membrane protein [Tannerellaceae bacterium]|nr:RagB/SusD family nutrient uptake outer membrane protein [Tannerellaceae bacterium]